MALVISLGDSFFLFFFSFFSLLPANRPSEVELRTKSLQNRPTTRNTSSSATQKTRETLFPRTTIGNHNKFPLTSLLEEFTDSPLFFRDLKSRESKRSPSDVVVGLVESEEVILPQPFVAAIKPHQLEGLKFMWMNVIFKPQSDATKECLQDHYGVILAHSMGLGKSFFFSLDSLSP